MKYGAVRKFFPKSGTLLSFLFGRKISFIEISARTIHFPYKSNNFTAYVRVSPKALTEIKHESTPASFSRVRGYMSNMTPGTVKRSIPPRLLLRKMIISQLELGPPVVQGVWKC